MILTYNLVYILLPIHYLFGSFKPFQNSRKVICLGNGVLLVSVSCVAGLHNSYGLTGYDAIWKQQERATVYIHHYCQLIDQTI